MIVFTDSLFSYFYVCVIAAVSALSSCKVRKKEKSEEEICVSFFLMELKFLKLATLI